MPDTIPPAAPTTVSATAASSTQVNVTWSEATDNVGVSGYRVERCLGAGCTNFVEVATPTGSSLNDTGLVASSTYRYRVRSADLAGNLSDYSTIASATTPEPPDTHRAVDAERAVDDPGRQHPARPQLDRIDRQSRRDRIPGRALQGSGCTNFAQIGTSTTTAFSNPSLASGTTYRYRVRAADAAGNLSGYSGIATGATPGIDTTAPSAPTGVTAVPSSTTQVDVDWTAATDNVGVTGYRVERCSGAACTNFAEIAAPAATSYDDTGRTASTAYRYRVRAVDAAGNLGAYSSIVTATTPAPPDTTAPSAPTGLTATSARARRPTWPGPPPPTTSA